VSATMAGILEGEYLIALGSLPIAMAGASKATSTDLRLLRELNSGTTSISKASSSRSRVAPRPSAARLPQCSAGTSSAAMRAKVEDSKVEDEAIEAKLKALKNFSKAQKKRTTAQGHKLDWRRQQAELQRERSELESARSLWLEQAAMSSIARSDAGRGTGRAAAVRGAEHAKADSAEGEVGAEGEGHDARGAAQENRGAATTVPSFQAMLRDETESDRARTEWRDEMHRQLRGIRELAVARGVNLASVEELLCDMRSALDQQAYKVYACTPRASAPHHALPHLPIRCQGHGLAACIVYT